MVLSSIRLVGCRKFIIHASLIRSYAVSTVAQVNSTPISSPHPNPDVLTQLSPALLKDYVNAGMLDAAIDVLLQTKSCVPCIFSCNFLLNFLVGCDKVELAVAIYRQLKRTGLSANDYTYTIMIKAFCVKGSFEEVFDVFREMEEAGVTPSAFAYSTYIEGLCKNRRTSIGFDCLRKCIKAKVPLDVFAYTVVIRGFCNEGKFEEANCVLLYMKKEGLAPAPDAYTYGALIYGFCRAGDLYKALDLHHEMLSRGIKTNCVIATSILQGLHQRGMPSQDVYQFFKALKETGILLDNVCYNVMINALCKMGEVEEAMALFIAMKGKQMVPDVVNYTTLIGDFFLKGRLSDARDLFVEMKENFHKLDIVAYNVIVGGLARNDLAGEAFGILNEMEAQGFKPNFVTHNMIIEGLCIDGKVKEAEAFFNNLNLEEKCSDNYSAMIIGYCKANCTNKAFDFFIRTLKKGFVVKKGSCLKLLHNLCTEDNYEKAQSVFDYLVSRGHIPDVVIYTIMINGYCRMNRLREACNLLGDMTKRGIIPDVITCTVLLDSCPKITRRAFYYMEDTMKRKEKKLDPLSIWSEMKDMDIQPDVFCYTVLIDKHCKTNNIQDAITLFNEMIDRGLEPDTVTYTALLSGHCNVGDIDKAEVLFNEMLDKGMKPDDRVSKLHMGILKARKLRSIRKHGATPGQQFEP